MRRGGDNQHPTEPRALQDCNAKAQAFPPIMCSQAEPCEMCAFWHRIGPGRPGSLPGGWPMSK